jgi:hypothetical protein
MCYFHVMFNCNKHFSMLSKEEKELVLKLVRNIHMAISNKEASSIYKNFKKSHYYEKWSISI